VGGRRNDDNGWEASHNGVIFTANDLGMRELMLIIAMDVVILVVAC
jgi:hypothetical protein